MSFDAWVVGFGLSRVLVMLELLNSPAAYGVWFLVAILDAYLLYLFFSQRPAFSSLPAES